MAVLRRDVAYSDPPCRFTHNPGLPAARPLGRSQPPLRGNELVVDGSGSCCHEATPRRVAIWVSSYIVVYKSSRMML